MHWTKNRQNREIHNFGRNPEILYLGLHKTKKIEKFVREAHYFLISGFLL